MQRHRKYLVITIWISTIAFIGAGFVGWGQYSYGDKAGAVAKVGDISITSAELQRSYSNLFNQYNQLFQGKFDEKQNYSTNIRTSESSCCFGYLNESCGYRFFYANDSGKIF